MVLKSNDTPPIVLNRSIDPIFITKFDLCSNDSIFTFKEAYSIKAERILQAK